MTLLDLPAAADISAEMAADMVKLAADADAKKLLPGLCPKLKI